MALEAINNSTMAYQGSVQAPVESSTEKKFEVYSVVNTAEKSKKEGNNQDKTSETSEISEKVSENIKKAIEQINKHAGNTSAKFDYNPESNRITVKIYDVDTEEVIKEFPPEKTLDMISKAWEMVGLLVDEKR